MAAPGQGLDGQTDDAPESAGSPSGGDPDRWGAVTGKIDSEQIYATAVKRAVTTQNIKTMMRLLVCTT